MTSPEWLVAWAGDAQAAVLEVTATGRAADAVASHVPALVFDEVASRVAAGDRTLWPVADGGPAVVEDAPTPTRPPAWVDTFDRSREVAESALALREELAADGVTRVVLCSADPGAARAAEAIVAGQGGSLLVVDPSARAVHEAVASALGNDPSDACVVLVMGAAPGAPPSPSRSGLSHSDHTWVDHSWADTVRRAAEAVFGAAGVEARSRLIAIVRHGDDPVPEGRAAGASIPGGIPDGIPGGADYRATFGAEPAAVGGFAALTAASLVPAALAGGDVLGVLDDAEAVVDLLCDDAEGNPALVLAAGVAGDASTRPRIALVENGPGGLGLDRWIEVLIGGSFAGGGLVPVVVGSSPSAEVVAADDVTVVGLLAVGDPELAADASSQNDSTPPGDEGSGGAADGGGARTTSDPADVTVTGPLGAQFLLWQYAAAVAGRMLGVDPWGGRGS